MAQVMPQVRSQSLLQPPPAPLPIPQSNPSALAQSPESDAPVSREAQRAEKWGNLDAIPTPGKARNTNELELSRESNWGNLDAIPTPDQMRSSSAAHSASRWADLGTFEKLFIQRLPFLREM
jgi:hypothetical protein